MGNTETQQEINWDSKPTSTPETPTTGRLIVPRKRSLWIGYKHHLDGILDSMESYLHEQLGQEFVDGMERGYGLSELISKYGLGELTPEDARLEGVKFALLWSLRVPGAFNLRNRTEMPRDILLKMGEINAPFEIMRGLETLYYLKQKHIPALVADYSDVYREFMENEYFGGIFVPITVEKSKQQIVEAVRPYWVRK